MKELTNKTLMVLLLVALVVTLSGTFLSLNQLFHFQQKIQGVSGAAITNSPENSNSSLIPPKSNDNYEKNNFNYNQSNGDNNLETQK